MIKEATIPGILGEEVGSRHPSGNFDRGDSEK